MKIFEELKSNIEALREYIDGDDATADTFDNLELCIGLLEKGYSLNKEIEEFETYDLDEIPEAGTEWLEKAQEAIAESIKLGKLETRIGIFLCDVEGVTMWESYWELEKSVAGEEYDEEKILLWEPFKQMSHQDIYHHINNY